MTNSKQKGKRGELEIVHILQEHGYDSRRTAQYCGSSGDAADVTGLPGIHIEVKLQERMSLYDWYGQAVRDSEKSGYTPIVIHRASRKPWLVSLSLDDFLKLLGSPKT